MSKLVMGAQLFTLREFCKTLPDLQQTLAKVSKIGYTTVQVSGIGPIPAKDVAKAAADNGLAIVVTHIGWPRFLNELDAVIEDHKAYNCKHPAVGALPADYRTAEGLKKFLDELAPVAAKLAQAGMDFSYHNHDFEFVRCGQKTWLEMLYEQAAPDMLKAELDTYWIQAGGGDPAVWIRKCAGREPVVHFKDMCITADRKQQFAEIGEGNLNWPAIMDAVKAGGVEYIMVEQDDCYGRDPFESLAISYRNLRAMGVN